MKTMEEKAAEVTTRWQELYPGGGPTSLSVADTLAAEQPRPKQVYRRVPWNSIDWEAWRKNMGSAINRTAIIIDGANRGNNNARLRNIKPPVMWFEDIAVGEKDEGLEFAMWSVVPPEGFEITFFGDEAKDRATRMAKMMLADRTKK